MSEENKIDLNAVLAPENQHETVALARALCPFAEAATDAQVLICVAMVEARGDIKAVAAWLGYSVARLRGHLQSRLSGRIIKELARHKLTGEGYLIAVCALMDVAESQAQTGNARNNAAKTLMELADKDEAKDPNKGDGLPDLNTMTLPQLEAFVNTIKSDLLRLPAQAIDMPE